MKKRNIFIAVFFCALLAFLIFLSFSRLILHNKKRRVFARIEAAVQEQCSQSKKDFSLLVKDLSFPNSQLMLYSNEEFPAASLAKLPVLVVALGAVKERRINFDDVIVIKKEDITSGSGILKSRKLPIKVTFMKLLELMISRSDNTASNKVIDILGVDCINTEFKKMGLKNTVLKRKMMDFDSRAKGIENYTTTSDLANVLEKIYRKKFLGRQLSEIALSFLKGQQVNDRLPRYLPADIVVAHKTGLENGIVHDAGIIFTSKGNYIICVLTRKFKDYSEAKKFIADLSLLTYNLYE
jgi:beta-lactamase class A